MVVGIIIVMNKIIIIYFTGLIAGVTVAVVVTIIIVIAIVGIVIFVIIKVSLLHVTACYKISACMHYPLMSLQYYSR